MVITIENQILVRFEPVKLHTKIVTFLHAEIAEWNKQVKQKCLEALDTFGTVYALSDNDKLTKFCKALGGKVLTETPVGVVVRFN